jgi:hypothetical protein
MLLRRLLLISIVTNLCYSQANFVAVGTDVTTNNGRNIAYSIDGISWTVVITNIFSVKAIDVTYSSVQNKWLVVGWGTVNTLASSSDGINWVGLGKNPFSIDGNGIAYSSFQNRWVAVGQGSSNIYFSSNGLTWTPASGGTFVTAGNSVAYSASIDRWVAVGQGPNTLATSPDGITWTGLGSAIFPTSGIMATFGNGMFIVSGGGGQAWSSDGISWTLSASTGGTVRRAGVYAQNRWLLVGPSPQSLQSSIDGKTMVVEASPAGITDIYGITYNGASNRYVAVGLGANTIIYSSDGVDWYTAGAVFSSYGFKVATNGLGPGAGPPPTPIIADVTNLVTNSSIINTTVPIGINGNLTVFGDLTIKTTWIVSPVSAINITGTLAIYGNTTFNAIKPINCDRLTISSLPGGSELEIVLTANLTIGASITYVVVTYNSYSGSFNRLSVRSAPTIVLSVNECPVATQDYSSSTLTVTVTMISCDPQPPNFAVTRMSTEMIVGIAVGSAVGASILILVVVIFMKRHRNKMDALAKAYLRNEALSDLKDQHEAVLKMNPAVNM